MIRNINAFLFKHHKLELLMGMKYIHTQWNLKITIILAFIYKMTIKTPYVEKATVME